MLLRKVERRQIADIGIRRALRQLSENAKQITTILCQQIATCLYLYMEYGADRHARRSSNARAVLTARLQPAKRCCYKTSAASFVLSAQLVTGCLGITLKFNNGNHFEASVSSSAGMLGRSGEPEAAVHP